MTIEEKIALIPKDLKRNEDMKYRIESMMLSEAILQREDGKYFKVGVYMDCWSIHKEKYSRLKKHPFISLWYVENWKEFEKVVPAGVRNSIVGFFICYSGDRYYEK